MEIKKPAIAGTLESSDCMVTIRPGAGRICVELDSDVEVMFGDSIRNTVTETLRELDVVSADLEIRDRGALDCVIRARVQCAVSRSTELPYNWVREDVCRG